MITRTDILDARWLPASLPSVRVDSAPRGVGAGVDVGSSSQGFSSQGFVSPIGCPGEMRTEPPVFRYRA